MVDSNIIETIIFNFKESLGLNYYSRDSEKDEFLRWLQKNINYDNGVLEIPDNPLITETEQVNAGNGDVFLKNLVKTWAYTKKDKQEYWSSLLVNNIRYDNGVLIIND
ncbi:MAG: hypothetical protein IJH63_00480 [Methanobrevibacter sp.]|nr:hypothetical protein [Methanosphaera sp.]MBR0369179.1 hypothetical protein [Methanobrevibacter sp.]